MATTNVTAVYPVELGHLGGARLSCGSPHGKIPHPPKQDGDRRTKGESMVASARSFASILIVPVICLLALPLLVTACTQFGRPLWRRNPPAQHHKKASSAHRLIICKLWKHRCLAAAKQRPVAGPRQRRFGIRKLPRERPGRSPSACQQFCPERRVWRLTAITIGLLPDRV